MDGIYNITAATPLGPQQGILSLQSKGTKLTGMLKILGHQAPLLGNRKGDSFAFSCVFQQGFFVITVNARGSVKGDTIEAIGDTNFGQIRFQGKKQS